jgi:uncharacterized membrane protein
MSEWPRFSNPEALVLLAAVPWTLWLALRIQSMSGVRKWFAVTLRTIILFCIVFALAGAEWVRTNDDLAVFFLLDHSDSVPESERLASAQWVRNAADAYMTERDKAGVVVFGEDASLELSAAPNLGLRDIYSNVGGTQTDLAAAIRLAMAAFPQGHMKRIVVYSDGNETRGAAVEEAKIARAAGVEIVAVPLETGAGNEVRLTSVSAPNRASADEPFQLRVVASADEDTEATLRIYQRAGTERRMLAPQTVTLQAGDNTFVLSQELTSSGFYEYEVELEAESDTVRENNTGRAFTIVYGEPRVLVVAADPRERAELDSALRAEGVTVDLATPGEVGVSLAQMQSYDAMVLVDVSATDLATTQMETIQASVRDLGVGLVMVGGPHTFGAGGFLDTPIEEALPVDMDIKQRKMLPRGALALILHTMEFPDGNAWANEISMAALNVLSAQDLMGLLAYDWQAGEGWLHDLRPVGDKRSMTQAIRQGTQNIGDMPDVGTTLQMAYDGLINADAAAKRVIIISDGDPAAPTTGLLSKLTEGGISVSTVCINPHSPNDQNMLRNVAQATGGQFYFVSNPNNLPQIFTKEASVVKRGLLIEEPFSSRILHDSELLQAAGQGTMPQLRGYVVTTAKDTATVPLVSHEDDPVLAHWRYGLGKAVAFTSDATGRWAADWVLWEGFNSFWSQTVRWATRDLQPSSFRVETFVRDGRGHVRIDAVDDSGKFLNFLRPRGVVTDPEFGRSEIELPQTAPGIYEAEFPLGDEGVYMLNLSYTRGDGTTGTLPAGLALGYSREYEYTTTNLPLLEELAAVGGGRVIAPDANPFEHTLTAAPAVTPLWRWLVIAAVCLFPAEIFVRRVVLPWGAMAAAMQRGLRRVPGVRGVVPTPRARPQAVTGAYLAARAATRDYSAAEPVVESTAAFGVAPPPVESPQEQEREQALVEPAAPKPDGYTQSLLAAKERALKRKTQRTEDTNED